MYLSDNKAQVWCAATRSVMPRIVLPSVMYDSQRLIATDTPLAKIPLMYVTVNRFLCFFDIV